MIENDKNLNFFLLIIEIEVKEVKNVKILM